MTATTAATFATQRATDEALSITVRMAAGIAAQVLTAKGLGPDLNIPQADITKAVTNATQNGITQLQIVSGTLSTTEARRLIHDEVLNAEGAEANEARRAARAQREADLRANGQRLCVRCGGSGQFHTYGECFRCGGNGIDPR